MFMFSAGIAGLLLVIPMCVAAQTQTASEKVEHSFRGKHRIDLSIGLLSEMSASAEVSAGGVTTTSDGNGLLGSIAYTYYPENDFGVNLSLGILDADATTSVGGSGVFVESASVVPLLLGVKYQPSRFTLGDVLRPYVSASIGPYFGFASNVRTGVTTAAESISETALGSRLAIGIDLLLGRLFTLGVGAGYHLVSDFDNRIGSEENYSSPEFSLSFGIAFGG